jgi:hypothetical protein
MDNLFLDVETPYADVRRQMEANFFATRQPGQYDFWVRKGIPTWGAVSVFDMPPLLDDEEPCKVVRFQFDSDNEALAFYLRNANILLRMEGMTK